MIFKLLKYELKASSRIILPSYGILFVMGIIDLLLHINYEATNPAGFVISSMFSMVFMAVVVVAIIVIIQRFHKNLLSDEGYLIFSLPVRTWQLVASKFFASLIWALLGVITAFITISFFANRNSSLTYYLTEFVKDFMSLEYSYPEHYKVMQIQYLLIYFSIIVMFLLSLFASLAIGQLSRNYKILLSTGAFLCFLFSLALAFVSFLQIFVLQDYLVVNIQWVMLGGLLVISIGLFLLTSRILSKRLNLE